MSISFNYSMTYCTRVPYIIRSFCKWNVYPLTFHEFYVVDPRIASLSIVFYILFSTGLTIYKDWRPVAMDTLGRTMLARSSMVAWSTRVKATDWLLSVPTKVPRPVSKR